MDWNEDDAQLALAIAQSQIEYERNSDAQPAPAADQDTMEVISVQDDCGDEVDDWEMTAVIEASVAAHQQQQQADATERALERVQLHESVNDAQQHYQSQRDAALAADLTLIHTVQTSQEEADARMLLQVTATPQPTPAERENGCWDCLQCTFRNKPYAPTCAACGVKAPTHVLTFDRVVPNVQFGVELELLISNGLTDGYSCSWLAKELSRLGIPTAYEGYTHTTTKHWKVVTDASLSSASQQDLCCEVVSPVLCGEEGIRAMRAMIETIRRIGIGVNSSCGFHVHVDAEPTSGLPDMSTLRGLRRLSQSFVALEGAFDSLVGVKRRQANHNKYCQSNRLLFGHLSNKQRWHEIGTCNPINGLVKTVSPDRYRKLNLTNLSNPFRPSTVEFRQHGGVDELLAAEAWVRLILRFCEQVLCSSVEQLVEICCLHQNATEKDEIDALFRVVGCSGLRSYYTLDRRLYSDLEQSWQCKVCQRRFRDSRGLAQHAQATRHRFSS